MATATRFVSVTLSQRGIAILITGCALLSAGWAGIRLNAPRDVNHCLFMERVRFDRVDTVRIWRGKAYAATPQQSIRTKVTDHSAFAQELEALGVKVVVDRGGALW